MAPLDPSPESGKQTSLKRARPVQSCTHCRAKKLKCDRQIPCETCTKQGIADQCRIDTRIGSLSRSVDDTAGLVHRDKRIALAADSSAQPSDDGSYHGRESRNVGIFEALEQRVRKLEALLGYAGTATTAPLAQDANGDTAIGADDGMVPVSQLDSRPPKAVGVCKDAKNFIHDASCRPEMAQKLKEVRAHFPKSKPIRHAREDLQVNVGRRMLEQLPSKQSCDETLRQFFDCSQGLHPIFDRAHFYADYERHWATYDTCERMKSPMIPSLLMMVVLTHSLRSDASGPSAIDACDMVSEWLRLLSDMQFRELRPLQVHALYVHNLKVSVDAHPCQIWIASGNLVRCALTAGIPTGRALVDKGVQSGATQKKLWASIVELDLQASILRGLPPALSKHDYVTYKTEQDDVNHLHTLLEKTLPLRLHSARFIGLEYVETSKVIPKLAKLKAVQEQVAPRGVMPLHEAIFDVYIHRSILSYSRTFLQSKSLNTVHATSIISGLRILAHLRTLSVKDWHVYFRICSQDILQALQIFYHVLRLGSEQVAQLRIHDPSTGAAVTAESLSATADVVLRDLVQNVPLEAVGNHLKELIALAIVFAGLRVRDDSATEASRQVMEKAFADVTQKLLARARTGQMLTPQSNGGGPESEDSSPSNFGLTNMPWDTDFDLWLGPQLGMNLGMESEMVWDIEPSEFQIDQGNQWFPS